MKSKDSRLVADLLKDRHSVRKFDQTFNLDEDDLELIIKAARFSPSSFGILNSRIIVIKNKTFRQSLLPYFYYQTALVDCSVYLLFVVDHGDYILSESIFKARKYILDPETLTKHEIDLSNIISSWDERLTWGQGFNPTQWSIAQTYINMTASMIQAEQLHIDTTPHEGFNQVQLTKFLQERGYLHPHEVVGIGLALGKVNPEQTHANNQEKIRKSLADYVLVID
ncbi:hypothetical protein LD119_00035 [Mesoplasma sp. JKS002660]|uniref:nitroreductase family protein n=1 Tax=Mesoplasma whartonense TaxID=2878854 RepID=UPI002022B6F5|nr:nitroreductase family protein [Mesoplasma sp. JKS002660]MCL8213111.1 hypothetical protein [Mesoplasma sp. JKS002660]